jgi:NitT/TauT family transport system ATP-binding protein
MALIVSPGEPRTRLTPAYAAIALHAVSHVYAGQTGRVQAIAALDLEVPTGQFIAVLGPSGCGKTTLLRIMSGLLEPSEGNVRLGAAPPAEARRRRAIGWLAQDDGLLPWRNVFENVELPLRIARRSDRLAVLDLLERVGLTSAARQYPHELSGGMRQRAALARALVARPPFLFLDEPFAHLDELTRERLGDLVLELRARSAEVPTTVLVTHSVVEAVRLADRVVMLSQRPGQVVLDTPIELAHPRHEDDPTFGRLVRALKSALTNPLERAARRSSG